VGGKADFDPVAMDAKVRMMVFGMGDKGRRVHKCQRLAVIGKVEGFMQPLSVFGQRPSRQQRQSGGDFTRGELVFTPTSRGTAGIGEGGKGELWHGALSGQETQAKIPA